MLVGIYDPVQPMVAPDTTFPTLVNLRVQIIRVNLDWNLIATRKPDKPTDPADPAYDWTSYDRVLLNANKNKIQVLFTVIGTPRWAQGKKKGINRMPSKISSLRYFAQAAAKRYSGKFKRDDGTVLPPVRKWLAWNEPNNPVFLQPQFTRVHGKWQMTSAVAYAQICSAVYAGVHAAGGPEQVACGATAPRGYNDPNAPRQSSSPLAFLRAVKKAGLRTFDAWAHHPYYGSPSQTPTTRNVGSHTVGLGNIDALTNELTRLYGPKHLWITEYGYQTRPPDMFFG
ncbi:MAG TPA: hypothetical protein VH297_10450, partial [Gaiellaceae bacterium]